MPVFKSEFGGNGNDEALGIHYTSDNGSIIFGRTTSNTLGDYDGFILKLDASGNILWSKKYGGNGNDVITELKPTKDGGWVVIGETTSFGNSKGEPFIIKLTNNGSLQWTKKLIQQQGRHSIKDIIEMNSGQFATAIILNDSTANSDGLLLTLSSSGDILWGKIYNKGFADGLHSLFERNDTLFAAGFVSVSPLYRNGLIMKINKQNGTVYEARYIERKVTNEANLFFNVETNGIDVDTVQNVVRYFSNNRFQLTGNYSTTTVTYYKLNQQGNRIFEMDYSSGGIFYYPIIAKRTSSGGFATIMNDSSFGMPIFSKINFYGGLENSLKMYPSAVFFSDDTSRLFGLEQKPNGSFLLAGYFKPILQNKDYDIRVYQTDDMGFTGNCKNKPAISRSLDTTKNSFVSFSWSTVKDTLLQSISVSFQTNNTGFTERYSCKDSYCAPIAQAPTGDCFSSFFVTLKGEGYVRVADVNKTNDGGGLSVGSFIYNGTTEPYISKLRSDGTVAWTKSFVDYLRIGYFVRILQTDEPNAFFVFGTEYDTNDPHSSDQHSILIKIKDDGTVLWTRKLTYNINAYDAVLLDDGGLILIASRSWGSGAHPNYFINLDKNGNVRWKKQGIYSGGSPVYRSIYKSGNFFYTLADDYATNKLFRVDKFSVSDGSMVWNRRFQARSADVVRAQKIVVTNDTVYLAFTDFKTISWNVFNNNPLIVKLKETNGELIEGYRITSHNVLNEPFNDYTNVYMPTIFTNVRNDFSYVLRVQQNGGGVLTVMRLKPWGEKVWSKQFSELKEHYAWSVKSNEDQIFIAGRVGISNQWEDPRFTTSFLMRLDKNGEIDPLLTGNCEPADFPFQIQPANDIEEIWSDYNSIIDEIYILSLPITHFQVMKNIWSTNICSKKDNCTNISLTGPSLSCSSIPVIYKIQRGSGCTTPASWYYDSAFTSVLQETDSTLKVVFKKNGSTSIKAAINGGCAIVESELNVSIPRGAGSLFLGRDTSLCANNSFQMNAGGGFATYLWQNGSTDSTFMVTTPGLYHVTVTDACSNTYRDTVVITAAPPVPLSIGADRSKCNNDTLQLTAPAGFLNYSWGPVYNISATNTQQVIVNPAKDTIYYVRAEKTPGCFGFDTVFVKVNSSPPIDLGADERFCNGDSVVLRAGNGFTSYNWSNGATAPQLTVKAQGSYAVTATTAQGCSSADTMQVLQVYANPVLRLNKDSLLCTGSSRILDAGAYTNYAWNTGQQTRTISITTTGSYSVTVTDANGCKGRDTTVITRLLPLPARFLGKDTSICSYGTLELQATAGYRTYLWNTGAATPKLTISKPGQYVLTVTDANNCRGGDTVNVLLKQCLTGFYMPNAFTPNNDGLNDDIKPFVFGDVEAYVFTIYNRFGETIFTTRTLNEGWNGMHKGLPQDPATFTWKCSYQLKGEAKQLRSGTLYLVR